MFNVEFYDDKGRLDHNANVASLQELAIVAQGRTMKIIAEAELSHEEAMQTIRRYEENNGLNGLLETLEHMKPHYEQRLLSYPEMRAFNLIFNGMKRLFLGEAA